jgi:hypothetical protein
MQAILCPVSTVWTGPWQPMRKRGIMYCSFSANNLVLAEKEMPIVIALQTHQMLKQHIY